MIRTKGELDAHLAGWPADGGSGDDRPIGFILLMEGADPIVEPSQAEGWWNDGLRMIGLAHYGPSAYAFGTDSAGPLTARGRELVKEMDRLGFILDAAHLTDESFNDALDRFQGPVMSSHSNCRALVPGDRQISDEMARRMIERGAVIGAVADAWMLKPGWVRGETTPEGLSITTIADHIDHICQLAGNADHAAIGSDLDGGYGTEQTPEDLDTIADLQNLVEILGSRGYWTTTSRRSCTATGSASSASTCRPEAGTGTTHVADKGGGRVYTRGTDNLTGTSEEAPCQTDPASPPSASSRPPATRHAACGTKSGGT